MSLLELIVIFEQLFANWGYLIIVLASALEMSPLGWLLPGGVIISIAGFYSYGDTLSFSKVVFVGTIGALVTFLAAYYSGKKTGNRLVVKLKQEKRAKQAGVLLNKHGPVILTTSMMGGLTRFWVAYVAGAQKYSFSRFFLYASIASLTWTSLMATVGYLAGSQVEKLEPAIAKLGIASWGLVILAIGIIYWKSKQEFKKLDKDNI